MALLPGAPGQDFPFQVGQQLAVRVFSEVQRLRSAFDRDGRQPNAPRTVNSAQPGGLIPAPAQQFPETASFPTGQYSQERVLPGSRGQIRQATDASGVTLSIVRAPDPFGFNFPIAASPLHKQGLRG